MRTAFFFRASVALSAGLVGVACASLLGVDDVGYAPAAPDATTGDALGEHDVISADAGSTEAGLICGAGIKACGNLCEIANTSYGCAAPGQCAPCQGRPNATTICDDAGACGAQCIPGFEDCNHLPADGCEARPDASDPLNCGACGVTCNAGDFCNGTACVASCSPPNPTPCDASCVDTTTSVTNCNGCGHVCPVGGNARATCIAGSCGIECTDKVHDDCNKDASDGCEITLTSDALHCGQCSTVCPAVPGATPLCSNGACSYGCDSTHLDCNLSQADGCECNLNVLGNHCSNNVCVQCLPQQSNCSGAVPCCAGLLCNQGQCAPCTVDDGDCRNTGLCCSAPVQACQAGICSPVP